MKRYTIQKNLFADQLAQKAFSFMRIPMNSIGNILSTHSKKIHLLRNLPPYQRGYIRMIASHFLDSRLHFYNEED